MPWLSSGWMVAQWTMHEGSQRGNDRAHFLKTSAAMGTVELTGLEMMATQALGQYLEMPSQSP